MIAPFYPVRVVFIDTIKAMQPGSSNTGQEGLRSRSPWMALDNKRDNMQLYCLQKAAVDFFPSRCKVEVIACHPRQHKCRGMDGGRTVGVRIGRRLPARYHWNWRAQVELQSAVARFQLNSNNGKEPPPGRRSERSFPQPSSPRPPGRFQQAGSRRPQQAPAWEGPAQAYRLGSPAAKAEGIQNPPVRRTTNGLLNCVARRFEEFHRHESPEAAGFRWPLLHPGGRPVLGPHKAAADAWPPSGFHVDTHDDSTLVLSF